MARPWSAAAYVLLALAACTGAPPAAGQSKPAPGQSKPAVPAPAAGRFDSSRAWEHLRRQVALGPRPAGSAALAQCRRYILDQLKTAGIEAKEQVFVAQTPAGAVNMANIVATIPGKRPERIALASHYDTKRFDRIRFVGASDGGSSTAALLELARILKTRKNEYTIELIFFDGEEAVRPEWQDPDNTYGSRHYVETARRARTLGSVKALVLLDMIGDRNLNIRRDSNSTGWLTDIIWSTAARLGYGAHFLQESFPIGGDDHFPFLAAGVPAVDVIDFDYAAWHTAGDTIDAVSARSLQVVGDVVLESWPLIEKRVAQGK